MDEVLDMKSEHGVVISKIYKDPEPTQNMIEKMGPKHKKTVYGTSSIKAEKFVAEKIKKDIPIDGSIEAGEYKPPEIDWDKVNPRVKPSYIKKVEMRVVKKASGKPAKVSSD